MSDQQKVVKHGNSETTKSDEGNNAEISQKELSKVAGGHPGVAWSGPGDEGPEE